jgi:hypothetical protein
LGHTCSSACPPRMIPGDFSIAREHRPARPPGGNLLRALLMRSLDVRMPMRRSPGRSVDQGLKLPGGSHGGVARPPARRAISMRTSQAGWGPQGVLGSLCRIRFAGPVFRFGQNPVLGFCFGREVSDMRVRTISCFYRNEPATGFYHFRHKVRDHLGHCRNMRRDSQWRRMAVWPLTRRYPRTFGVGHKFLPVVIKSRNNARSP